MDNGFLSAYAIGRLPHPEHPRRTWLDVMAERRRRRRRRLWIGASVAMVWWLVAWIV